MAEVYEEKPQIVTVTVAGEDDTREFHVAGHSVEDIGIAIRSALAALGTPGASFAPKKVRKPRATKKEMAARAPASESAPVHTDKAWPA